MKVHGYGISENVISKARKGLQDKKSFDHAKLEQILKQAGIPHYDKISLRFIAYDAASRIIKLWKNQKLIEKYTDNMGSYWIWVGR